ncbi:MAG TPA: transketolase C-terminal domain-containing protein [Patescibacteria group bacterium]|nr:transketolase C-terminal domain-containing protein [Patescibacteria group bacterium]
MLNPHLKLNEKVFDADAEQKPTRDGFGKGIVALGEKDENVVVLTADLSESTRCDEFEKKFPERFFDVGVAEQDMATVAAGLGVSGKTAFISSYATFSPGRNWEPLRTTVVYNNSNVKIAGHHSGIMTGPDGATHQATEDIAITRCWPDIQILVPCDAIEAKKATMYSGSFYGPAYLRFSRDKTPLITTDETPFDPKKIQTFWVTDAPVATIFATGYMLSYALLAAKELEEENIHVLVANVAVIKPIDEETIQKLAKETGAFVTVEDHQVMGGMGSAIAEVTAKHCPTPIEFIGLQDTFAESGKPAELIEKYHMGKSAIKEAVKKVVKRK